MEGHGGKARSASARPGKEPPPGFNLDDESLSGDSQDDDDDEEEADEKDGVMEGDDDDSQVTKDSDDMEVVETSRGKPGRSKGQKRKANKAPEGKAGKARRQAAAARVESSEDVTGDGDPEVAVITWLTMEPFSLDVTEAWDLIRMHGIGKSGVKINSRQASRWR